MNRIIKEATVKRFHYDSHDQLRTHLADFMAAYNFARRLETLSGFTPYEYIIKVWTSEPDRFTVNQIHQTPGPSIAGNRLTADFLCLLKLTIIPLRLESSSDYSA